jgi:hypothetical protein
MGIDDDKNTQEINYTRNHSRDFAVPRVEVDAFLEESWFVETETGT